MSRLSAGTHTNTHEVHEDKQAMSVSSTHRVADVNRLAWLQRGGSHIWNSILRHLSVHFVRLWCMFTQDREPQTDHN